MDRKIYILLYDIYGVGGTVRTTVNTANYLAKMGYDVEIVSVFRYSTEMFFPLDPNVKISVLNSRLGNAVKNRTNLVRTADKKNSLLIHRDDEAYNFFSVVTDIKLMKWLRSVRNSTIISTRPSFNIFTAKYAHKSNILVGQEHLNFSIYPEKMKRSMLKYYPKLNHLLTLTDKDTEQYAHLFRKGSVEVRKITNSLPPLSDVKSDQSKKVIITAGRLAPQKGYDLLIQSFAKVVDKHPDWALKIYGKGRDKAYLQEIIHETGTYNNIFILPPVPNIEDEFASSSIFALSSRYEGFGMVLVEAMSTGLPLVSFDCPEGPGEIITDKEDGFLVEPENIDSFAHHLDILMSDKDLRTKMGKNALENVERFSIESIGREWVKLFDEIEHEVQHDESILGQLKRITSRKETEVYNK